MDMWQYFVNHRILAEGVKLWSVPTCYSCCSLFSCLVMSDSLWPQGPQHSRLPYSSISPRVCSDLCPLCWWCHPTILSSVSPFSSCPQSFPALGAFPMSFTFHIREPKYWSLASASVLPVNIQGWFPLGLMGLSSLLSKRLSRDFSSVKIQKHQFFNPQPSLWSDSHIHTWLLEKP